MTVLYGQTRCKRIANSGGDAITLEPGSHRIDRDHRRQAILDVAGDVFHEEGFAATSMATIAAKVGGSKATLYNYFPSKESLFAALVRRECQVMLIDPLLTQTPTEDPASGLAQIGRRYADFTLGDRALSLHRLVLAEASRFPELGRVFYDNGPRQWAALLADWLAAQNARDRLRVDDPDLAASQFLDLCRSGLLHKALWRVDPPPGAAQIQTTVEAAVRVFMAAYGAR